MATGPRHRWHRPRRPIAEAGTRVATACQMARAEGVPVSIHSDAHSVLDFDKLHHGIGQARRGWLGKADVPNTRTLAALRPLLARTI